MQCIQLKYPFCLSFELSFIQSFLVKYIYNMGSITQDKTVYFTTSIHMGEGKGGPLFVCLHSTCQTSIALEKSFPFKQGFSRGSLTLCLGLLGRTFFNSLSFNKIDVFYNPYQFLVLLTKISNKVTFHVIFHFFFFFNNYFLPFSKTSCLNAPSNCVFSYLFL